MRNRSGCPPNNTPARSVVWERPPGRPRRLGALRDRALPLAFRSQSLFDLCQRQAVHDVLSREPAFAGNADSKPQILQAYCSVGIRIDYAFNAFLLGQWPPAPVEIEPLGCGIEFNPCAGARCRVEDCWDINLVRVPFEQQPTRRMRKHRNEWIFQGADDALSHLRFAQTEDGMH